MWQANRSVAMATIDRPRVFLCVRRTGGGYCARKHSSDWPLRRGGMQRQDRRVALWGRCTQTLRWGRLAYPVFATQKCISLWKVQFIHFHILGTQTDFLKKWQRRWQLTGTKTLLSVYYCIYIYENQGFYGSKIQCTFIAVQACVCIFICMCSTSS